MLTFLIILLLVGLCLTSAGLGMLIGERSAGRIER